MGVREHVLRDPDLHDGRLLAMEVRGNSLLLRCTAVDGQEYAVTVGDLVRLRADNFLQGNIIFELLIFAGSNCPEDLVRSVYQLRTDDKWIGVAMEEIRRERWTLLQLESSYGCSLVALSKGAVDVRPVDGPQ